MIIAFSSNNLTIARRIVRTAAECAPEAWGPGIFIAALAIMLTLTGCDEGPVVEPPVTWGDASVEEDAGDEPDADAGDELVDAGTTDAGRRDAGRDLGLPRDAGTPEDAGPPVVCIEGVPTCPEGLTARCVGMGVYGNARCGLPDVVSPCAIPDMVTRCVAE